MRKNRTIIKESQLRNLVKEAVKRVLNEVGETEDGQRRLAALQYRNEKKWLDAHKDDDNRDVPKDVVKYAYKKSRGNDALRAAYLVKNMTLDPVSDKDEETWKRYFKREYPNNGTIDVEGLWDELERYARKTGLKIIEGVVDGIVLMGYEDDFSMKAAYADVAFIAGNYGINPDGGVTYARNNKDPRFYDIRVNCSFTDEPNKKPEDKRGDQQYLYALSSLFS